MSRFSDTLQKIKRIRTRQKLNRQKNVPAKSRKFNRPELGRNIQRTFFFTMSVILVLLAGYMFILVHEAGTLDLEPLRGESIDLQEWEEDDRMSIALVGLDSQGDFAFIDYFGVMMLDPKENKLNIINVNVDAYVFVPSKNTSYQLRTLYNLAKIDEQASPLSYIYEFTANTMTVDIERYIILDEQGFKDIVDAVGGVTVSNDQELFDEDNKFLITQGKQHLNGSDSYRYLAVDEDSQNAKLSRQNDYFEALYKRSTGILGLYRILTSRSVFEGSMISNLDKKDVRQIAKVVRSNPDLGIGLVGVSEAEVFEGKLFLNQDAVFEVVHAMYLYDRVQKERARIEVFNGTDQRFLGGMTSQVLQNRGFDVIRYGNPGRFEEKSIMYVTDQEEYADSIALIQKTLDFEFEIRSAEELLFVSTGDIVIVLGEDYHSFY